MKRIHLGLLLAISAAGFYGFQLYSGQKPGMEREAGKGSQTAPMAVGRTESPPQAASAVIKKAEASTEVLPPETSSEGNRASYRDIDRLKAERTPEALDALLKYLDHPSSWVKAHALRAIGAVGSPRAITRVAQVLSTKNDVIVIRGAYMAIGGIGPHLTVASEKAQAVEALKTSLGIYRTEMTQDSRSNVYQLIEAAGHITGSESGEFLIAELSKFHDDPLAQYSIVKAMGESGYRPAQAVLEKFKTDLVKEGAEPWGDKELYSDLVKATDESIKILASAS